ncbi:hypothetical protein EXIGLDRAFT_169275 [Exidia glandulosa HHB12029]|uniref:Uncharacterized protein n=1 Tax=Exidia glandulosa HHB12029 TaxID=1314781 RepID=A0A165N6R9_EXIGL|nr:hypothetical protein EXIGLDRAFT_169275 [Exidia glandulosa HHB12029]
MSVDTHESSQPSLPPSIGGYDASFIHHYRTRDTPSPASQTTIAGPSSSRDQSHTPRAYTPTAASSLASSPSRPKYARSSSTGRSRARSQRAEVLDLIMAEEDRLRSRLQDHNDALIERVEHEIRCVAFALCPFSSCLADSPCHIVTVLCRRADLAEHRAQQAELRARDAQAKAQAHATARQQADVEITRLHEEMKRLRQQVEGATRELKRAEAEMDALEKQRLEAEQSAVTARESARQYRASLEAQQAREAGLLEGRRIGLEEGMRGFLLERHPPSPRANSESLRTAYQRGRTRGYEEGRQDGMQTERQHALESFERFLADHEEEFPELSQDRRSLYSRSDSIRPRSIGTPIRQ